MCIIWISNHKSGCLSLTVLGQCVRKACWKCLTFLTPAFWVGWPKLYQNVTTFLYCPFHTHLTLHFVRHQLRQFILKLNHKREIEIERGGGGRRERAGEREREEEKEQTRIAEKEIGQEWWISLYTLKVNPSFWGKLHQTWQFAWDA